LEAAAPVGPHSVQRGSSGGGVRRFLSVHHCGAPQQHSTSATVLLSRQSPACASAEQLPTTAAPSYQGGSSDLAAPLPIRLVLNSLELAQRRRTIAVPQGGGAAAMSAEDPVPPPLLPDMSVEPTIDTGARLALFAHEVASSALARDRRVSVAAHAAEEPQGETTAPAATSAEEPVPPPLPDASAEPPPAAGAPQVAASALASDLRLSVAAPAAEEPFALYVDELQSAAEESSEADREGARERSSSSPAVAVEEEWTPLLRLPRLRQAEAVEATAAAAATTAVAAATTAAAAATTADATAAIAAAATTAARADLPPPPSRPPRRASRRSQESHEATEAWTGVGASSSSSGAHRLEQQLDERIQRHEASQSLEEAAPDLPPPPSRPVVDVARLKKAVKAAETEIDSLRRELGDIHRREGTLQDITNRLSVEVEVATNRTKCVVCMDASVNCIFLPCGHVVCCEVCGQRCQQCPICRGFIGAVREAFLP